MHDNLLSLHILPLHKRRANDGQACACDRDVESLRECKVVRGNNASKELLRDSVLELRGAGAQNEAGV